MRRAAWLTLPLLVVVTAQPAVAQRLDQRSRVSVGPQVFVGTEQRPTLHEPIGADPREDVALQVSLDGELPAAIHTPRGLVPAPDPGRPVGAGDSPYNANGRGDVPDQAFQPDRDTRRPGELPYDDPFSPSTAPFKRLSAFDAVDASYTLSVRDPHTTSLPVTAVPAPDATEELFYADMVVDLATNVKVRIPSVGPGARVLRARAGVGTQDVKFQLWRDGADNWFIEGDVSSKVRLVMELAIPRVTFGGDFGSPSWAELVSVPPLPPNVARAATEVAGKAGVSRRLSPHENVAKLVSYFRGFTESEEPPLSSRDIYLDLALSRKGVCRHRSFAFMVTAHHLGLPTRMVLNEAHAWVEVHDGRRWRRIDLGGAGRTLHDPLSQNVSYEPPADPFAWPQGSTRGEDLADRARRAPQAPALPPPTAPAAPSASASSSGFDPNAPAGASGALGFGASGGGPGATFSSGGGKRGDPDDRPLSHLTMALAGGEVHRGAPFKIRGSVAADGEPCAHVSVEIVLRSRAHGEIPLGVVPTGDGGNYDGAIVLPSTIPLGDYEVGARTFGDARCGRGVTR